MTTPMLLPVAAPPAAPPLYGLIPAAQVITGEDDHWEGGYTFVPEGSDGGGVLAPCDASYGNPERPGDPVTGVPFYVWESDQCSRLGNTPFSRYEDVVARARRNLQASESYHLAREFWKGELAATQPGWGDQPILADPASDVLTTGAATPLAAFACLEQGIAEAQRGGRGMIHCTPQMLTYWQSLYLIRPSGTLNVSALGTVVVADAGYDGSGPNGEAPTDGHQWAYGTGMVQVRLGPVQIVPGSEAEAVDRSDNTITVWVNRLASANWDRRAHVAAEVNVPLCGINGS